MKPFAERELGALSRMGDILLPGDGEFPSFSKSGCIQHLNALAAEADPNDIQALAFFLRILSFMPNFVLVFFCALLMRANSFPEIIAVPLRQLNIALRGMIISPYFANLGADANTPSPHAVMGYALTRIAKP